MVMTELEPLLNVNQTAEILGISPWTLRKYLREGRLEKVHIGSRVLVERAAIGRFIERGKTARGPMPTSSG
jgi:excisionase family DNA binding protein